MEQFNITPHHQYLFTNILEVDLLIIAKYLDDRDLSSFACLNRTSYLLYQEDSLWRLRITERYYGTSLAKPELITWREYYQVLPYYPISLNKNRCRNENKLIEREDYTRIEILIRANLGRRIYASIIFGGRVDILQKLLDRKILNFDEASYLIREHSYLDDLKILDWFAQHGVFPPLRRFHHAILCYRWDKVKWFYLHGFEIPTSITNNDGKVFLVDHDRILRNIERASRDRRVA